MRRACIILCLVLFPVLLFSQAEIKPIKVILGIGGGVNFPFTQNSDDFIADKLLYNQSHRSAAGCFTGMLFKKNWGFEISAVFGSTYLLNPFEKNLVKQYPDYYVDPGDDYLKEPSYHKLLVGPMYKVELKKLFLIGGFQAGVIGLTTGSQNAFLKRKGTNELLYLEVESRQANRSFPMFNSSATIGYRVFRKFAIGFDLEYSIYKMKADYIFTSVASKETREETIQQYRYNDVINELTVAVRFMLIIPER